MTLDNEKQAAIYLGIPRSTIFRHRIAGKFPAPITEAPIAGKMILRLWDQDQLDKYAKNRRKSGKKCKGSAALCCKNRHNRRKSKGKKDAGQ